MTGGKTMRDFILESLENQKRLVESMINAFKDLQKAIVKRDYAMVERLSAQIEGLSFEIASLEEQRGVNISKEGFKNIKEFIASSSDQQLELSLTELLEKLNELTILMDGTREMFEFENSYMKFVNTLYSGNANPVGTYSQSGETKNLVNNNINRYTTFK